MTAHLLEYTNQTACPWKVCWIWQIKRDQKGGRPRLGTPWLFWSRWIGVGFSMQGPSHPKAWKGVPGLVLPKPLCSSPSTGQTVQCSAELTKCKQVLRLPPSPEQAHVQALRSSSAVLQGKGMEPFPEGYRAWEQLWCAAVPACTAPCLGHHPWDVCWTKQLQHPWDVCWTRQLQLPNTNLSLHSQIPEKRQH